ncbi:hypothetical protein [Chondromyces apiculatus]|uniref:Uncharacterized protein n=1 Tax=Chondromyces apiculatus DSM 436 TaxID=1192034 RepID=A0A017TF86_9BACT|nr:hypothetical protein [Chondromyces apiculatus]EYF07542.1 Hypothetical protein CAP_8665 [Chondromyces apiculatus DSM 436]
MVSGPQSPERPWTIRRTADGRTVILTFSGKLSALEAQASMVALAVQLASGPHHVIWDLTGMSSYDADARLAWQRGLRPLLPLIRDVEVVGGNPLVRVGTVTLTMTLGLQATFSPDSIPLPSSSLATPLPRLSLPRVPAAPQVFSAPQPHPAPQARPAPQASAPKMPAAPQAPAAFKAPTAFRMPAAPPPLAASQGSVAPQTPAVATPRAPVASSRGQGPFNIPALKPLSRGRRAA